MTHGTAFSVDLPAAARRHLHAGDKLLGEPGARVDVAGYLFGIAAECALKSMAERILIATPHSKDAILYAHFPELRSLLRDALRGRRSAHAMRFIFHDGFMNNWHVRMRYSDGRLVNQWVAAWRMQAVDAVGAMESM